MLTPEILTQDVPEAKPGCREVTWAWCCLEAGGKGSSVLLCLTRELQKHRNFFKLV